MQIEPAGPGDLAEATALLERNRLPTGGLAKYAATLLVARDQERIVGTAALELYTGAALLRSVSVDPAAQGQRIGIALTNAALTLAASNGVRDVFLLTTTAERFFPRFGFETITREDVPESVRASVEFTSVCCASAVVMRKRLAKE